MIPRGPWEITGPHLDLDIPSYLCCTLQTLVPTGVGCWERWESEQSNNLSAWRALLAQGILHMEAPTRHLPSGAIDIIGILAAGGLCVAGKWGRVGHWREGTFIVLANSFSTCPRLDLLKAARQSGTWVQVSGLWVMVSSTVAKHCLPSCGIPCMTP